MKHRPVEFNEIQAKRVIYLFYKFLGSEFNAKLYEEFVNWLEDGQSQPPQFKGCDEPTLPPLGTYVDSATFKYDDCVWITGRHIIPAQIQNTVECIFVHADRIEVTNA